MKLGELLVRDKRITQEQLASAVERQSQAGGRMGTVLVEMGAIDLDTLTVYLGTELAIPIASGATLERAKKTAVKLLSPQHAARFRCIPIVIQHRQLIAAIDTPHDVRALDELSQLTGYRVVPRVAPEIRIYYYLERYYGVPRPKRFAPLGEAPRGSRDGRPDPGLPAPPLPGLPPAQSEPTPAPTPAPGLKKRAQTEPPPPPTTQEVVLEAEDLVEVLDADETESAEKVEELRRPPRPEPVRSAEPAMHPPVAKLEIDEAIAAIESATNRAAVADALMGYAANLFDVAVLFIVRDNMAFGWRGIGAEEDRVESLLIPLEAQSIFQIATRSGGLHHGHAMPATIHDYLFKVLRCIRPAFSLVSTVRIGGRNVNFLYGHRTEPLELSPIVIADIRRLCVSAGLAYQRLIARSRRTSVSPAGDSEDKAADETSDTGQTSDENTPLPSLSKQNGGDTKPAQRTKKTSKKHKAAKP